MESNNTTGEQADFWVECAVCKQRLQNWTGSTPCCGSIAYIIENGETTKKLSLFASVGGEIKPMVIEPHIPEYSANLDFTKEQTEAFIEGMSEIGKMVASENKATPSKEVERGEWNYDYQFLLNLSKKLDVSMEDIDNVLAEVKYPQSSAPLPEGKGVETGDISGEICNRDGCTGVIKADYKNTCNRCPECEWTSDDEVTTPNPSPKGVEGLQWVSVEDGTPKDGEDVLCITKGCDLPLMANYNHDGFEVKKYPCPSDRVLIAYWEDITHWMPLPQPPSESPTPLPVNKEGEVKCNHEHTSPGWAINQPSICNDCGEEL